MVSPSPPEPRMAQNSGGAASYGPVPTSPNTPTTPTPATVGDMSRLDPSGAPPPPRAPSAYVSSPLNPNASFTGPITRSRPPSAGSAALQAEIGAISRETSSEGDARNTLSMLSSNPNTLYAPLRPPSTAVNHRFSTMSSTGSILSFASDSKYPAYAQNNMSSGAFVEAYPYHGESPDLYTPLDDGPEDDDALHEPDPEGYKEKTGMSSRGCLNVGMIVLVIGALLALFISYPIVRYVRTGRFSTSTLVNATGQVPVLPGLPNLIDNDTPQEARTRTGFDGQEYELVFSDEFNVDGRSFYPGDDPFWEAVDLNYWATGDLEWYDPGVPTTKDGNLVITLTEVQNHNLNFMSGMIQSWNKFCFTNGYIEFNLSLPGESNISGYWPGAWIMGNLGRPGYGGTTDGVWPYTYDACDIGTFPNQTNKDGTPTTNADGGTSKYNYQLSVLSGQKLSACTCSNTPSTEHPGPSMSVGRGAPEIDALEAQKNKQGAGGRVSQSAQFAPFSYNYTFDMSAITVVNTSATIFNPYRGSAVQQAVSALTTLPDDIYELTQGHFQTFGFEYNGGPNVRDKAYITWVANGEESLTMTSAAVGPDSMAEISARNIAEEPMAIVLNLAMSTSFQAVDLPNMVFPSEYKVDYVRVYQRKGEKNVGCDPAAYPTSQYIANHMEAYTNPNITKWPYTFPKNSLYDGCD